MGKQSYVQLHFVTCAAHIISKHTMHTHTMYNCGSHQAKKNKAIKLFQQCSFISRELAYIPVNGKIESFNLLLGKKAIAQKHYVQRTKLNSINTWWIRSQRFKLILGRPKDLTKVNLHASLQNKSILFYPVEKLLPKLFHYLSF